MNKQLSGGGKRASSQPACSPLFHSHGDYFPHMLQNAILLCSAHLNYFINRMPLNKGLLNFEIHSHFAFHHPKKFCSIPAEIKRREILRSSTVFQKASQGENCTTAIATAVQALLSRGRSLSHTQNVYQSINRMGFKSE